jgi:hypothetical protein
MIRVENIRLQTHYDHISRWRWELVYWECQNGKTQNTAPVPLTVAARTEYIDVVWE